MDKFPQNTHEVLKRLEIEIEALRLKIGEAMLLTDTVKREKQIADLRQKRLAKIAEYENLGGPNKVW